MKNYHYARKRRQLKYLAKKIRQLVAAGAGHTSDRIECLMAKMKRILATQKIMGGLELRKALGVAAVFFGLAATNPVAAQYFAPPVANPYGLTNTKDYTFQTFVDLDNDGDLDMFSALYLDDGPIYGTSFRYYENVGTPGTPDFAAPLENPFGLTIDSTEIHFPTTADLDNDGDQDLLLGKYYGDLVYYENTGTDTAPDFGPPTLNPFGIDGLSYLVVPSLVDLDGDGDFDILTSELPDTYGTEDTTYLLFYENIGTPTVPDFSDPVVSPFGISAFEGFFVPAMGDIDGDGDLDILGSDNYSNSIYYENIGTADAPQFAAPLTNPFNLVASPPEDLAFPALGDLDNDSDLDLILADYEGNFQYYKNAKNHPVGTKELETSFELEVFPNPVNNKLVIRTAEDLQSLKVVDILGRTVEDILQPGNSISLGHLKEGMYTLVMRNIEGALVVKKIQKMN